NANMNIPPTPTYPAPFVSNVSPSPQQQYTPSPQQQYVPRWNTNSAPAPARGRNRAGDKEFQNLRATYLSNFDFRGIQCTATPLLPSVLRGVTTEMPVLFQIKVGRRSEKSESDFVRTPFNACLVLDVSGSMDGARLDNCKKAINAIIETLTPNDTLSLVTYSSSTKTVFTDCNHKHKEMMLESVAAIRIEGCTNLHAGLELGVHTLRQSIKKESSKEYERNSHRIFLFSDGLVNEGVRAPSAIVADTKKWIEKDVTISTFGIGDDYDETLMNSIAEAGNGESYFIESEEDIDDMVSKGLRGISAVIAPNATLDVRGLGDAVIKTIPGYEQKTPGQIVIKDLKTNGLIQFVVNLDIRVPGLEDFTGNDMDEVVDSRKVLGYSITLKGNHYVNLDDCQGMSGTVSLNYTTNNALVTDDKKDNDVLSYLTIKEAAEIDKVAMDHLANNRTKEALAAKKQVLNMYEGISSADRWGFSKVMQQQSERLVQNLETSGNTRFARKMCGQQQQESSTNDYGFGLFD
ncbi:hypothetical protein BGZ76_010716, partial [Entomortierella beljakovae]